MSSFIFAKLILPDLNELLEAEAEKLTQAARYERNEQRQGYRSGHYNRNLTTTSGDVVNFAHSATLARTFSHSITGF